MGSELSDAGEGAPAGAWSRDVLARALPAYEIGRELGRGAHGVVVAARHRRLERDVAVKQLLVGLDADTEIGARFVAEAKLLASLDHPHVVPIYDFVEVDGACALVMERLSGGTVQTRRQGPGFSVESACKVVLATCAALEYAHSKGVLHRDVKPQNLLFSREGVVKVADFGIARMLRGSAPVATRTGAMIGTPGYMAPEQVRGEAPSPAIDIYAAGTVLYELLCGRRPFPPLGNLIAELYQRTNEEPAPVCKHAPAIPAQLAEVADRAVRRDPAERYETAAALAAALTHAAEAVWGADWARATGSVSPSMVEPVVGTTGRHVAATATRTSRGEELLERDAELAAIAARIDALTAGEGGVVVLQGAAGIGKSQLVSAARARAAAAGLRVLKAAGDELEQGFPFGVIRELLTAPLRNLAEADRVALFDGAAGVAAALFDSAEGRSPDAVAIRHGVYWLIANLADSGPLMLIVDDGHWADAPSLEALLFVGRRIEELPVLLLIAARPHEGGPAQELLGRAVDLPDAELLEPAALSEAACTALAADRLDAEPDRGFVRACLTATGGNPFFLRELLASLAKQGVTPDSAASVTVSRVGPKTVARAVLRRVAALSPEAAALARALAVLGGGSLRRAGAVAEVSVQEAAAAADALADAQVLAPGRPLAFVHPIVRSAILDALAPAERAALHARAARALDVEGVDAIELASHLLGCEPEGDEWVVARLHAAAAQALASAAPDAAVEYLRRALAEPPTAAILPEVHLALGRALARIPSEEAIEHFRVGVSDLADPRERARAAGELGLALGLAGRAPEGVATTRAALAELSPEDGTARRSLEIAQLAVARLSATTRNVAQETLERIQEWREDPELGWVVEAQSALELATGDAPCSEVAERLRAALDRRRQSPYGQDYDGALCAAIVAGMWADESELVEEHARQMSADARARGDLHTSSLGNCYVAMMRVRMGDLAAAEASARQGLRGLHGWEFIYSAGAAPLVGALIERGELDEAAAVLDGCDLPERPPYTNSQIVTVAARGRLRAARGEWEQALADQLAVGEQRLADNRRNPADEPWRSEAALALLALGRRDEAQALAAEEVELARAFGASRALGIALRAQGLVEGGETGLALLAEAVEVLAGSPGRVEHARALVDYGAALAAAGRAPESHAPLRSGLDLATRWGARPLAERAREQLIAAGGRPLRAIASAAEPLSPSERGIAEIAAAGASDREIAQSLFVSLKTVQGELRSAYDKLGIADRHELAAAIAGAGEAPAGEALLAETRTGP